MSGLGRRVRSLVATLAPADRPDGELCAAWSRRRDEAAFAELVRRHGRLVWGVCRRGGPDPDDSYQAVFLLLARKAGGLSGRPTVAPWLFHAARRVSGRAARTATRRRRWERAAARPEAVSPPEASDWRPAFDAELAALPAAYRDAVVMCELGGTPRAEAAARLGVPVGTLASRLAAARVLLRQRLERRGVVAAVAVGLPPAVTPGVASAAARELLREGWAMATLKVVVVAGLLAGAGLAVGGRADPPAPPPADWMAEFKAAYGLSPGQAVKRIDRPFPKAREQFGFSLNKWNGQKKTDPKTPIGDETVLIVNWRDGVADLSSFLQGGSSDPDYKATTPLRQLIAVVCGRHDHEIEVEAAGPLRRRRELGYTPVPGDFAFDPSATLAGRVAALDRIVRDECKLAVRVRLETLDRPVLVAGGRFAAAGPVDVYGRDKPPGWVREGAGGVDLFLSELARWVRVRVADETEKPRPVQLKWRLHHRQPITGHTTDDFEWQSDAPDRDPVEVLARVAAQTGLTVRVERRAVPVVRVEPAE